MRANSKSLGADPTFIVSIAIIFAPVCVYAGVFERRQTRRRQSVAEHGIASARVRPGIDAAVVNVSAAGALTACDDAASAPSARAFSASCSMTSRTSRSDHKRSSIARARCEERLARWTWPKRRMER